MGVIVGTSGGVPVCAQVAPKKQTDLCVPCTYKTGLLQEKEEGNLAMEQVKSYNPSI